MDAKNLVFLTSVHPGLQWKHVCQIYYVFLIDPVSATVNFKITRNTHMFPTIRLRTQTEVTEISHLSPTTMFFSYECGAECRAHKQCPFCAVTLHFLHLDTFLFCFCSSLFRVHISPLYALNIRLGVPRQHNIPVSGNPSHKDSSKRRVRIHSEQSVTRNSRRLIQRLLMTNDNRVLHCAFSQRNLGPTRPNYVMIQYAMTLTVTTATN